jgi:hypothetical protein
MVLCIEGSRSVVLFMENCRKMQGNLWKENGENWFISTTKRSKTAAGLEEVLMSRRISKGEKELCMVDFHH